MAYKGYIDDHVPVIRLSKGIYLKKSNVTIDFSGSTQTFTFPTGNIGLASGSTQNVNFGNSSGTITVPTGGLVGVNSLTGNNTFWAVGGEPASGTHGNNTSMVAGTLYWVQLWVENTVTLTGVQALIGGTAGTDKWIVALFNSAGTLVANSATAGTNVATTVNTLQAIPFTATYVSPGPGWYFVGLQSNGTHATFQSYTTPGSNFITGSATGSFGTLALTPGSTYTNNVGPVSSVY